MKAGMQEARIRLIYAPGDGIEPAALLQVADNGPQYLFHVPEGFSRLTLEHHVRPGPKLRAVLSSRNPSSDLAGLAGLILRLKQDGHKEVTIAGPPGVRSFVKALHHLFSWTHPSVQVAELCSPLSSHPSYTDDYVEVFHLAGAPKIWIPPAWLCTYQTAPSQGKNLSDSMHHSSSADESDSPSESSSAASDSEESSSRSQSGAEADPCENEEDTLQSDKLDHFAALDSAFATKNGRHKAMALLSTKSPSRHSGRDVTIGSKPSNLPEHRYVSKDKSYKMLGDAVASLRPWGCMVFIRSINKVVLIINCESSRMFEEMQKHPIFTHLADITDRLALVLHFTPLTVSRTPAYTAWAAKLPGKQVLRHTQDQSIGFISSFRLSCRLHHICPSFLVPSNPAKSGIDREEGAKWLHWRLFAKINLVHASPANISDADVPAIPEKETIIEATLDEHPELRARLDQLHRNVAFKSLSHQKCLLPAVPCFPGAANCSEKRLQCSLGSLPDNRVKRLRSQPPDVEGTQMSASKNKQEACAFAQNNPNYIPLDTTPPCLDRSQEFIPPMTSSLHNQPVITSTFLPMYGYAQVSDKGRPIGVVQLTPQGWVGPPEAIRKLTSDIQGRSCHQSCGSLQAPPQSDLTNSRQWTEATLRGNQLPKGSLKLSPRAVNVNSGPQISSHVKGKRQVNASQEQKMLAKTLECKLEWNHEDIDLDGDDHKGQSELQSGGREDEESQKSASFTILGTGCAEPSKYRASSGILLHLDNGYNVLLDAGEGTYGQIIRYFGVEEAKIQVDNLAAVFISHRHADHLVGLLGILQARSKLAPPLLVVGPQAAKLWLKDSDKKLESRFHFLPSSEFHNGHQDQNYKDWFQQNLGLTGFLTCKVQHCSDAWGVRIDHKQGWSLCYSGDTRPCAALIKIGQNCDLLIHEATYASTHTKMAVQKRHSTREEAESAIQQANAKFGLLTHFSQRCSKFPFQPSGKSLIAFDGLHTTLSQLDQIQKTWPLIEEALKESKNLVHQRESSQRTNIKEAQTENHSESEPGMKDKTSDDKGHVTRKIPTHIRFDD